MTLKELLEAAAAGLPVERPLCEVCDKPCRAIRRDVHELAPKQSESVPGLFWSCWRPGKEHAYCAEHDRPGTEYRLKIHAWPIERQEKFYAALMKVAERKKVAHAQRTQAHTDQAEDPDRQPRQAGIEPD